MFSAHKLSVSSPQWTTSQQTLWFGVGISHMKLTKPGKYRDLVPYKLDSDQAGKQVLVAVRVNVLFTLKYPDLYSIMIEGISVDEVSQKTHSKQTMVLALVQGIHISQH